MPELPDEDYLEDLNPKPEEDLELSYDEIRERFFYATDEAHLYDKMIHMVIPHYHVAHEMIKELVHYYMLDANIIQEDDLILDIGFRTGEKSIRLLKEFKNLRMIGVDLCENMRQLFIKNCNACDPPIQEDRYDLITGNFLNNDIITQLTKIGGFNCIISSFTIHHLLDEQKRRAYQYIYKLLNNDGVFINLDIFNYEQYELCHYSLNHSLNFFNNELQKESRWNDLIEKWNNHYNLHNILNSFNETLKLMQKIGFIRTDNFFRYKSLGIVCSRKIEQ